MATMKLGEELATPPEDTAAVAPPVKTLTTTTTRELANAAPDTGDVEGEWGASDIKLPWLKLVQKSSDEALHAFGLGSLVFDNAVKLGDTKSPIPFVVFRMKKTYRQWLPYGSEERPQTFDTMEEAKAAGFALGNTKAPNYVSENALLQIAVKAPADADEDAINRFPYTDPNGGHWTMGLFTAQGSSYGSLVKALNLFRQPAQPLKDGLTNGLFEMHIEHKKEKSFSWYQPKPLFKGRNDAEMQAFLNALVGK